MLRRLLNLLPFERIEGYEHPELVDVIFRKTVAYEPRGLWPEIQGARTVLDFGGGCGLHYKQAKLSSVRWAVVETPAIVARAKELETSELRFFSEIEPAANWLGAIDVMHSNGAVQYTPDPLSIVHKLCRINATRMLWYRVFLGDGGETQVSHLQENGPGKIATPRKKVAYSFKRIRESDFLSAHADYDLEDRGTDWFRFVR